MWFSAMAPYAGLAHALAGRADEPRLLLDDVADMIGDHRSMEYVWVSISLAEAYLRVGYRHGAVPFVTRAIELARSGRKLGRRAQSHYLAAEIASTHEFPGVDDPAEEYGQALALATQLEMRPLAARCHLGLGQACRRAGDRARAGEHLATARAMLRGWTCASGWRRRNSLAHSRRRPLSQRSNQPDHPDVDDTGEQVGGQTRRMHSPHDEKALAAARAELGTRTLKDTANEALRRAAPRRDRRVSRALDTLARVRLRDRAAAWR